ncbi:MAG: ABC transporter permease [Bacteroidales bacterium]|jgi:ABC-2 type transport system permease protein|nr:ABC transporter permease [Bacteroidales bacterium]
MVLSYLIEKEFKQTFRNKFIPKLIIIFPFVALIILPNAANMEIKNVNLAVVDNDHSTFSSSIVQKLNANKSITLMANCNNYTEAFNLIEDDKADIILVINKDIEKNNVNVNEQNATQSPQILVATNSVNALKGTIGAMYVMQIVADFAQDKAALAGEISAVSTSQLEIRPFYAFNERLEYKYFMVPALMVMILTVICGFLPALNIVGEKENGNIEQMNVTPVKKFTFILSKLIPYWIIGTFVISIGFFVAWLIYGIVPVGSFMTIYFFTWLFIFAVSGMGLLISNYFETYQQAMFVMFFLLMILILMSGLFTSFNSMPEWAQAIGKLSPLKYFIEAMRAIYLKGSVISDLNSQLRSLITIDLVLNIWAIISYKKKK